MSDKVIRIVLADHHAVVRCGIREMIAATRGMVIIGEAETLSRTYCLCREQRPDVLLLGLNLPDSSPAKMLAHLCADYPDMKKIVLTDTLCQDVAQTAVAAGVVGCILKSDPPADIVQAVGVVMAGGQWFSQDLLSKLAAGRLAEPKAMKTAALTSRQQDVLSLLAQGQTNQEIALALSLSPRTVRHHLRNARRRLGLGTRTELVIWAVKAGFSDEAR